MLKPTDIALGHGLMIRPKALKAEAIPQNPERACSLAEDTRVTMIFTRSVLSTKLTIPPAYFYKPRISILAL